MRKRPAVFQMRTSLQTITDLEMVRDIINNGLLGDQARGRGAAPITLTDLVMLSLDYAFDISGARAAAVRVGMGFDNPADAVRRINAEIALARRAVRARESAKQEARDRLRIIQGGLAA